MSFLRAMALVALGAAVAGCPGRLKDPQEFEVSCPVGFNVETDLFQATCGTATCHVQPNPAGALDLASANVAARLIGQQGPSCPGQQLITSADAGLLFDKVNGSSNCGAPMPLGKPALTADQLACLQAWVGAALHDAGVGP